MKSTLLLSLFVATLLMMMSSPAHAYIDPGTGSFLIQGIIAAVIGVSVTVKLFWNRIKAAITGKPMVDEDDPDDSDE